MTTFIPSLTLPHAVFANPYISTALPIVLGSAVGYLSQPKRVSNLYASIKQPPLRPPPWVFGPAWTLLYGLMGYAAHRAIASSALLATSFNVVAASSPEFPGSAATHALARSATLYSIQLGLNLIWMPLFFVWQQPVAALADVVALVGLNGYLASFWGGEVDQVAGWCMVPYVAWLGFATYLTAGTGYLNGWDFKGKTMGSERKSQ